MKNILNIINFVRAIEPRPNRNIDMQEPMREQIRLLRENGLRGTFLLQYDALVDPAFDSLIEDAASFCENNQTNRCLKNGAAITCMIISVLRF